MVTFVADCKQDDDFRLMMQIVTKGVGEWGWVGNFRCCLHARLCSSVDDAHCNIGNKGDVLQEMIKIVTRGCGRGAGGGCSRSLLIANKDDCKRRFFSGDAAFSRHVLFLWRGVGGFARVRC